jgi:hypothetical protein
MSANQRRPAEIAAEVCAALMKAPQSMHMLRETVGVSMNNDMLRKYVEQFRLSGCVYVHGFTRRHAAIYAWQPSVFHHADQQRPAP